MFAYIDPMAGSVVLQVVIASVVGGLTLFRQSIARLFVRLLGRKSPRPGDILPFAPRDELAETGHKAA